MAAWSAAGRHLQSSGSEGIRWIRRALYRPFAEHFSFSLGNQLFFIYVPAAEYAHGPTLDVFKSLAQLANAIPCIMPIKNGVRGFETALAGWGLIHALTGMPVNPAELVSDELVVMSDWELHDRAIQITMNQLEKQGYKFYGRQSDPRVQPHLWCRDGDDDVWILVRAARHPEKPPQINHEVIDQARGLLACGDRGVFRGITFANYNEAFDPEHPLSAMPLFRGQGVLTSIGDPVILMEAGELVAEPSSADIVGDRRA